MATRALTQSSSFDETETNERFRALANPTRRRLLRLIVSDGLLVGELAARLGTSQPATSQHLKVLREAGLVTVIPAGRQRQYCADVVALRAIRDYFDDYWDGSLDRLKQVAEHSQGLLDSTERATTELDTTNAAEGSSS